MTVGFPKPRRGSAVLEREKKRKDIEDRQAEIIKAAKARDGYRCRWPEAHKCRGLLEGAHIEAKGMGGDHGERTYTGNIITLCAWIHRRGPDSLEHHQLRIETETERGADGPLSFWREGKDGKWYCVGRELAVGILCRD